MTIKTRPGAATGAIATLCLALSACVVGDPAVAPVPPLPGKLSAENMVDAAGVAAVAVQRTSQDTARLLNAVFMNYVQQTPTGDFSCANGGSLTLSRPAALVWDYSAHDCNTGQVLIQSGHVQIDASQGDALGLKLVLKDAVYLAAGTPSAGLQTIQGSYSLQPANTSADLQKTSPGELSVMSNGRADGYSDIYIASRKSDSKFLQYAVKLKSPRFAHELTVVSDVGSKSVTAQSDDGSVVTLTELPSGFRLELRRSAGDAVSISKTLSDAEFQAALTRARL